MTGRLFFSCFALLLIRLSKFRGRMLALCWKALNLVTLLALFSAFPLSFAHHSNNPTCSYIAPQPFHFHMRNFDGF